MLFIFFGTVPPLFHIKSDPLILNGYMQFFVHPGFYPYPPILYLAPVQAMYDSILHNRLDQQLSNPAVLASIFRFNLQLKIHRSCFLNHCIILYQLQFIPQCVGFVIRTGRIHKNIYQRFHQMLDLFLMIQNCHPFDRIQRIINKVRRQLRRQCFHTLPVLFIHFFFIGFH